MNISPVLEHLMAGNDLSNNEMEQIMRACMKKNLSDAQLAAFLVLMRVKGETAQELTSAAKVLMDYAHTIDLGKNLIDIVGTGGDGKHTFNVSTASSIVTAAAGVRVAKHGSTSVSSNSGSANVLSAAGIVLDMSPSQLQACLKQINLCFLFAPHFHPTFQAVRMVRQQLGVRTFFNLLGPLINPAHAKRQVVGVFSADWQMRIAEVLANLGSERAFVISSEDGLDEISICAPTRVVEYHHQAFNQWRIDPKEFGCFHPHLDNILVSSPEESLKLIIDLLSGKPGAARDIVVLNSALALYCAEKVTDFANGIELARNTIDSGKAYACFESMIQFSKLLK